MLDGKVIATKEAIEKFLEAKSLGINVHPFLADNGKIWLKVEDQNDEDLLVQIAEFKLDFNSNLKVYGFRNLVDYDWATALIQVCKVQTKDHFWKIDQNLNRVKAVLDKLENL